MNNRIIKKIALGLITVLGTGAVLCGVPSCAAKSQVSDAPANVDITKTEAPKDGSLPTAYYGTQNLAFMAAVLDSQTQYHCYSETVTTASIATQVTKSYKDFRDGVLVSSDVSYSSMVKSGTQTAFVKNSDGVYEAYMRTSATPDANTDNLNAKWDEGVPVFYNLNSYLYTYGLLQTEMTNYILNDETVLSFGEVIDNRDGTYTQKFVLDPEASTYYLQFGMKTRGGLNGYPEFQRIEMTLTFDSSWRVLSNVITEDSKINKGFTMDSSSRITVEYSYDEQDFSEEHFAFYDSYFKKYIGSDDVVIGGGEEEFVLDVTTVLSNGFSKILEGGQQFQIKASLGRNTYSGYLFVGLDISDPLSTLKLKLSLGKTLSEQAVYLEYADGEFFAYYNPDFAVSFNLSAIKPIAEQFAQWAENLDSIFSAGLTESELPPEQSGEESGGETAEGSDPLSDLMNLMSLEIFENSATLSLITDDILGLGVGTDASFFFGVSDKTVNFRGAAVKGLSFGGKGVDLNLSLVPTTAEIISCDNTGATADLAEYAADVYKLLSSDLLKINFALDGSESVVSKLGGLKITAEAFVDLDGVTVGASLSVSYIINNNVLSADIYAFYDYDPASTGYGNLVVGVTSLNGKPLTNCLQVKCGISELIEAVKGLLTLASAQTEVFGATATFPTDIADIVNAVFSADLSQLVTGLYADGACLAIDLNIDTVLQMFGVDTGINFGGFRLEYNYGGDNGIGELGAYFPAVGFSLTVTGADGEITNPVTENALDLVTLVKTAESVYNDVLNIINSQSLRFELAENRTYITVDGITAGIDGAGEITWSEKTSAPDEQGNVTLTASVDSVALKLRLFIIEQGNAAWDELNLDFTYAAAPAEGQAKFIIAVNGVGIYVYDEDIQSVKDGISKLLDKFGVTLTGSSFALPETDINVAADTDALAAMALDLICNADFDAILQGFSISCSQEQAENGATAYMLNVIFKSDYLADVKISSDGALTLEYDFAKAESGEEEEQNVAFATGMKITVSPAGNLLGEIINAAKDYKMASSADGEASFIRLAYDYLFDAINAVSVENILGSNTYAIEFLLDGGNFNLSELKDVYVNANMYFTGKGGNQGRLTELQLDMDVKGAAIKINAVIDRNAGEQYFYINLSQVMNIMLPDLKVVATQSDLYDTIDSLVSAVLDTNVIDFVKGMVSGSQSSSEQTEQQAEEITDGATGRTTTDLIYSLLNFDINSAFVLARADDITTAVLDLDSVASQFGISGGPFGCVEAVINHSSHSIKTSATAEVTDALGRTEIKEWMFLSSALTSARDYTDFDKTEYISVAFLPDLIDDLVKTATDSSGDVYKSFTFSGNIYADILPNIGFLNLHITVSDIALTLGFTENNEFYFSFMGKISGTSVDDHYVGVTYRNNYLTLARYIDTAEPQYKVMTMAYFLDNIFASGDQSPVNWLLQSSLWGTVVSALPADVKNVDSGLTTAHDVYLYDYKQTSVNEEISIYDYIDALNIIINGNQTANITNKNDINALESKFGLTDNYYGVDLNAGLITGDVLTELYLAITRDDETGINGIKAYGDLQSYIKFTADLVYCEGLESDYAVGSGAPDTGNVKAPDFYALIEEQFNAALENVTYTSVEGEYKEVFGAYNSSDGSVEKSKPLYTYTLTVHESVMTENGLEEVTKEYEVSFGATVRLYDNSFPVYSASGNRIAYTDENGNLLGTVITDFAADTEIWAAEYAPAVISVYNNGEYFTEISSFVGDEMPSSVPGYTTLSDGTYLDPELAVSATGTVTGNTVIYGLFAQTEITVNYVNYKIVEENGQFVYHVIGSAAGYVNEYCTNGNTLVLENEIGGFKVTAIEKEAFRNLNDACLKSVVVPANIVTVGENAFTDNFGIQSIVFLADSVHFKGSGSTDASSYPFYGCSTYATAEKVDGKYGNEITSLTIYYNNITANDDNWKVFRYVNKVISFRFYIGSNGGALVSSGWNYVQAEIDNQTEFAAFDAKVNDRIAQGVTTETYDLAAIQSEIQSEIDLYTSEYYGCITLYTVNITAEKNAFGAYVIKATLADGEPKYLVTINRGAGNVEYSGECALFNGNLYARGEVTFTATDISNGYEFENFTYGVNVIESNPANITISGVTEITVNYIANIEYVNIISKVSFNYAGTVYDSSSAENNLVSVAIAKDKDSGALAPAQPEAEGYVFLGWAAESDGALVFTQLTDKDVTYYAVWGVNNNATTNGYAANESGSLPNEFTATDGTFYNWYADAAFSTAVSAISAENTVLFARWKYTVSYTATAPNRCVINGENKDATYSGSIDVLEGQEVIVELTDSTTCCVKIDGETVLTVKLQTKKTFIVTWYEDKSINSSCVQTFTASGNASISITS